MTPGQMANSAPPVRGQVYSVDVGGDRGRHYYVIVSNNDRNRKLKTVIGLMITSSDKSGIPSAAALSHLDPVSGYAVADLVEELWRDELDRSIGSLCRATMTAIDEALKIAFAIE